MMQCSLCKGIACSRRLMLCLLPYKKSACSRAAADGDNVVVQHSRESLLVVLGQNLVCSKNKTGAAVGAVAGGEALEDEDDETCGFCIFMKAGGCKDEFNVRWPASTLACWL